MAVTTESWMTEVLPQNGALATVRPIRPSDVRLVEEMHRRLSPESVYYRYLQYRTPLLEEIEQICRMAPEQGAGLVATVQQEAEIVVGIAYYVREGQKRPPTAEAGILIEDQYQGQGIGRRLWQQLLDQAQANQICWLRVLFEPSNQRVRRLVQGSGFAYQAKVNWWLSEYLVVLDDHVHPPQWQRILNRLALLLLGQDPSPFIAPVGLYADDELFWSNPHLIYPYWW